MMIEKPWEHPIYSYNELGQPVDRLETVRQEFSLLEAAREFGANAFNALAHNTDWHGWVVAGEGFEPPTLGL